MVITEIPHVSQSPEKTDGRGQWVVETVYVAEQPKHWQERGLPV